MSDRKDLECRGLLWDETPNAILVTRETAVGGGQTWWIPKSQIGYRRTTQSVTPGGRPHVVFTLPEWLIEKKECWDLV